MLTITSPVSEITTHVFEPIARQFVRKFLGDLNYTDIFKDSIYYSGDYIGSSKSNNANHEPIVMENKFNCNLHFNLNPRSLKWDAATFKNIIGQTIKLNDVQANRPVFYDNDTKVMLTEQEVPATITMNCSMIFLSRTDAYEALSRMLTKYMYGEMIIVTDFSYDYAVPKEVLTVLYATAKLKGVLPTQFQQYLKDYSNSHITTLVNRNAIAGSKELVVQRNTFNTYTQLDYSGEKPEPEQTGTSPMFYKIDFTATLQFSRINLLLTSYPIVVNNQLIPAEIVNVDPEDQYGKLLPKQLANVDMNTYRETLYPNNRLGAPIRYPWYDNWMVPEDSIFKKLEFEPFFIGVVTLDDVDNPDGVTTIDLTEDLGDFSLTAYVIENLQTSKNLALYTNEVISVAVYVNDTMIEQASLELTDGTTLVIKNRSLNNVYRVVLSKQKEYVNGINQTFRIAIVDLITYRQSVR